MKTQNRKAFTLIEVMVVILIVGILAAIALPFIQGNAWASQCEANIAAINTAIDEFKVTELRSIMTLDEVGMDQDKFPDGMPVCPFGKDYVPDSDSSGTKVEDHNH